MVRAAALKQYGLVLLTAAFLLEPAPLRQGAKAGGALSVTSPADLIGLIRRVLTTPVLLLGYGLSAVSALLWLSSPRLELSYATPLLNGFFYVLLLLASALGPAGKHHALARGSARSSSWSGLF